MDCLYPAGVRAVRRLIMRRTLLTMLAAALLAPAYSATAADTYTIDGSHSDVTFRIRHLVSKVPGRFGKFEGKIVADPAKPEASSVEFTIKADSIDTNNDQRDKHLRSADFFDVAKYPTVDFRSTKVTKTGDNHYDVAGTLKMHGVSKEIVLPVEFLGFVKDPWGNERAGFEISTQLNRKDYGIVWNQTLDTGGLLLGEEVQISINIEAVKAK